MKSVHGPIKHVLQLWSVPHNLVVSMNKYIMMESYDTLGGPL